MFKKVKLKYSILDKFKEEFIKSIEKFVGFIYSFLFIEYTDLDIKGQKKVYTYISLIALDMFKPYYYLYYRDRNKYINNFLSIINFNYVN